MSVLGHWSESERSLCVVKNFT